ncbi:ABC transporter ATP-binding protein [Bacillus sp. 3255]|uniref:ABC transporter ATP-binding protein n=1 Tax=Bacillus sp. 3255 TaxID=2817904 RepID=UPI0028541D0D|nr:ABC transporter ATP-binding protein [Bacillus sp. 3255]MDR6883789.1 hypothetical protein [Bacillus sp. 3255]
MGFGKVSVERSAIEKTYEGLCTITEFQTMKDPFTKITGQQKVIVLENEPCALSQTSLPGSMSTGTDTTINFDAKLFISPDITINAGCEIRVIQNGMDLKFEQVGLPFRYATHQELMLKQMDRA